MKEMKQDSSTIAWNAMGDEWFELAQSGEARNYFIMPKMLEFMGDHIEIMSAETFAAATDDEDSEEYLATMDKLYRQNKAEK